MERRFAIHAGGNAKALTRRAWATALVLSTLASSVAAQPKKKPARAQFDKGVAAYKKNSYEAASAALGKSFELEPDPDTLFAWAQAERKLDHCEKALELYEKLLTFDLPAANKAAVQQKHDECNDLIGAKATAAAPPEPTPVAPPPVAPPPTAPAPEPTPGPMPVHEGRSWYKDPIALSLLGVGVIGVGVGGAFLVNARSTHNKIATAANDGEARELSDTARSRQQIGLIAAGAGGALIIGGVVWIVTHRSSSTEAPPVTAWLGAGGGGLALSNSF
ncbi:MAG TPA: hypothetical protein VGC42_18975 [Kofleriaceae bacterium]